MEFIIISGLSGAGKSCAAEVLEDMGFFCVDNLPIPLIGKFAELVMAGQSDYNRVALVTDIRSKNNFEGFFRVLDELETMNCPTRIFFLDSDDEIIIRRYKETRRAHPLLEDAKGLKEAITLERQVLMPLRARADVVIDTGILKRQQLRDRLHQILEKDEQKRSVMQVRITSFGFKHGIPLDADLVFDVRFLPNPFYLPALRPLTGLETQVAEYVFADGQAQEFIRQVSDLLVWLLPRYRAEGKSNLTVSIGCTGGKHRSVAVAHKLTEILSQMHPEISEIHRDFDRLN